MIIKQLLIVLLMMSAVAPVYSEIRVAAAYPYIRSLTEIIGEDRVRVTSLSRGEWDPHFVVPRPSLSAEVRRADLLIVNGASLETGWLPPVIRESRNRRVQPGTIGYLDLSLVIQLIDIPGELTRDHGDVHPEGNPHFVLDPHNIPPAARAIARRLSEIDPGGKQLYEKNLNKFLDEWNNRLIEWDRSLGALKGRKVIQYHKTWNYLIKRYGMIPVSEIEPRPGIPPAARHIRGLIDLSTKQGVDLIFTDVYHSHRPARYLSEQTGVRLVILPHDVGAVKGADDIFGLFEELVRRLTHD